MLPSNYLGFKSHWKLVVKILVLWISVLIWFENCFKSWRNPFVKIPKHAVSTSQVTTDINNCYLLSSKQTIKKNVGICHHHADVAFRAFYNARNWLKKYSRPQAQVWENQNLFSKPTDTNTCKIFANSTLTLTITNNCS